MGPNGYDNDRKGNKINIKRKQKKTCTHKARI